MLLGLLIAALTLQVWVWSRLTGRLREGRLSVGRAVARYAATALLPFAGFAVGFFSLVGLEEWLGVALLSEPLSRATPVVALLLLAFFVLGSSAFAIWSTYVRASQRANRDP
jgi:hypothetical protein